MQLTIFSCSPQVKEKSASAFIAEAFRIGFTADHQNSAFICHLRDRGEWKLHKKAFAKSEQVLFVLPLYVDCIPGILMEFLEYIEDWRTVEGAFGEKRLSFIVQSGFPEALQLRVCEKYLEQLPSRLGCQYGGTLLKGGQYGVAYAMGRRAKTQTGGAFAEWGKQYAKTQRFTKEEATAFAAPERFSKKTVRLFKLLMPASRIMWNRLAKRNGATQRLDAKPYL
ncbi:MAG: hypothetical protein QM697_05555 [Lachnospiraceae bacterium]